MKRAMIGIAVAATVATLASASAQEADPEKSILVFKTPWCGCCQVWADKMIEAGYTVETRDMNDLSLIKKQGGVTDQLAGCHTSVIGGERKYVLEGHVPIAAVEKLMSEKPDVRRLGRAWHAARVAGHGIR
ncbi:MAG: DUF411 domain-containing protein [Hyphomicrobiales bacterium]